MEKCNRAFISYRSNRDVFGLTPWTWHRHPVNSTASGDKAPRNHYARGNGESILKEVSHG